MFVSLFGSRTNLAAAATGAASAASGCANEMNTKIRALLDGRINNQWLNILVPFIAIGLTVLVCIFTGKILRQLLKTLFYFVIFMVIIKYNNIANSLVMMWCGGSNYSELIKFAQEKLPATCSRGL